MNSVAGSFFHRLRSFFQVMSLLKKTSKFCYGGERETGFITISPFKGCKVVTMQGTLRATTISNVLHSLQQSRSLMVLVNPSRNAVNLVAVFRVQNARETLTFNALC